MDKAKITPKDFFLWAGTLVSFYWSVVAFILLILDYIDYAVPNPLSTYLGDPYQGGIPYEMASIIVLFPLYLVLSWVIRRDITKDASRADIWVRRWALLLTLFVAGVTMAVDLITLLTTFLRGEDITLAFILKVLIVLLVAAGVFMHFIADLWGYWAQFPARRNRVVIGVVVLALTTVVVGFFIVGTPAQARLYRFDESKVTNLTAIQSQVVSYYQLKKKLPSTLADLNDSISGFSAPTDAQTSQPYEYQATGALSFELCATFNKERRLSAYTNNISYPSSSGIKGGGDNWQHGPGRVCFDRTIDPQLYPPVTTPATPVPAKGL